MEALSIIFLIGGGGGGWAIFLQKNFFVTN